MKCLFAIILAIASFTQIADLPPLPDHDQEYNNITPETMDKELIEQIRLRAGNLPTEYDPRTTPDPDPCLPIIMNQGSCGSCYAFAASYSFVYRLCRASGNTTILVPNTQEIVTCDGFNGGCNGGESSFSLRYIALYGVGSSTCKSYNTSASTTASLGACTLNVCDSGVVTDSKYYCKKGTPTFYRNFALDSINILEQVIKEEVYTNGPVVTSIISSDTNNYFGSYHVTDGALIMTQASTNEEASTDHAISIIGWGADYWIIANSWTANWGYQGYAKIAKSIRKIATNAFFCYALSD